VTVSRAKCPKCGRQIAAVPANPWRPFCSERCRLLDLGAWLSERHAIPGEKAVPDPDSHSPDET
jgi:uncharacterized protein